MTRGNNTHPAPFFHHESVEEMRRRCLLHREPSYTTWPPVPLPEPSAEDWRAGFCITYWWMSGRRDLLHFALNHGAAKKNRR